MDVFSLDFKLIKSNIVNFKKITNFKIKITDLNCYLSLSFM